MARVRTHYDNLKVTRNATVEDIRTAYKSLSQKHHPDRNGSSSESQRIMSILNDSYSILSDSDARIKHDAWIAQQETSESQRASNENHQTNSVFSTPSPGEVNFYQLDQDDQRKFKERASNRNKSQYKAMLGGVIINYVWICILSVWFFIIYFQALDYQWSSENTRWLAAITGIVSLFIANNLAWIYSWHAKPLQSSLIITPIYLMKFHFDRISYWPIWTISNIQATHNYRNGIFQNTSVSITLDGKRHTFYFCAKNAYESFINRLQEYDLRFRTATNSNKLTYIMEYDDFQKVREQKLALKKSKPIATVIMYFLIPTLAYGLLGIGYKINQAQPPKPAVTQSTRSIDSQLHYYFKPLTAPNGSAWPTSAAYIDNYPILNSAGLSSVTVDNSQNNSEFFLKLFYVGAKEKLPVRVFFIPAHGSFKLETIDAGLYDIRYRNLSSGGLTKSDPFTLKETPIDNGTRYSNITITLYKVKDGNMHTHSLSEDDF